MALVVSVAMLIAGAGCKHQTPEQKQQARLQKEAEKQAKAQAKAQQQQARAQVKAQEQAAKAQADAAKKQAEAEKKAAAEAKKQADAQAKADAKHAAEEKKHQDELAKQQAKQADAQAKAEKKAADERAAQDKKNTELAAKEQKKQADALAKADKKNAKANQAVAEAPMKADAAHMQDIEPAGPTMAATPAPAEAMTVAAHQGYGYHADDKLKVVGYPDFKPENNQRLFDRFVQAHSASGQDHDASLSEADFDGTELNSTGRANLALALQYPKADNKLTIYVATSGGEELMSGRVAAVERYWKGSPWSSVALTTRTGLNTVVTGSVKDGVTGLKNLEKLAEQETLSGSQIGTGTISTMTGGGGGGGAR
jgi:hypothetical protein